MIEEPYLSILSDEEVVWLKENCNRLSYTELAKTLHLGTKRIKMELEYYGIVKNVKKSEPIVKITVKPEELNKNDYDKWVQDKKIRQVKIMIAQNKNIGPYKPIKAYKHFVLCINKKGHKENFTYEDLAKLIKG